MGIYHSAIRVSPHRRGPGKIAGCPHPKYPVTDFSASDGLCGNCVPRNLWSIPPAYPIYKQSETIRRQPLRDATVLSHRPGKYVKCPYVKAENRRPPVSRTTRYPDKDRLPCDEFPLPSDKFLPALPGEVQTPPNPSSASLPLRERTGTHDTAYSYGRPKAGTDQTQKARIPHSALYPFFMLVHLNLYFVPDVYFPHCCCSDGNFVFRSDSDEAPAPHLPLLAEHFPQPPEVRDYFSGGTDGCFGPEGLCSPVLSFQLPGSVCCCLPPPEQQAG